MTVHHCKNKSECGVGGCWRIGTGRWHLGSVLLHVPTTPTLHAALLLEACLGAVLLGSRAAAHPLHICSSSRPVLRPTKVTTTHVNNCCTPSGRSRIDMLRRAQRHPGHGYKLTVAPRQTLTGKRHLGAALRGPPGAHGKLRCKYCADATATVSLHRAQARAATGDARAGAPRKT